MFFDFLSMFLDFLSMYFDFDFLDYEHFLGFIYILCIVILVCLLSFINNKFVFVNFVIHKNYLKKMSFPVFKVCL